MRITNVLDLGILGTNIWIKPDAVEDDDDGAVMMLCKPPGKPIYAHIFAEDGAVTIQETEVREFAQCLLEALAIFDSEVIDG